MKSDELKVAIEASEEAGKMLLERFSESRDIESKTQFDFVTDADKEAERIILSRIRQNFPQHMILSEESKGENENSDHLWIVDPLDGTTNYTVHNPFFDVSIALARDNEIIMGVVYAPFTKEMFYAEKGKGTFLNGKRISVSEETEISKSLLVYCHKNTKESIERIIKIFSVIKPKVRDFNRMRAGALELALVAAGKLGAYVTPDGYLWDSAAGSILVQEAGGRVTDFRNNEWKISEKLNIDIVASNGRLHDQILKIVRDI